MRNNLKLYANQFHNLGLNVTCITNYLTEFNFRNKVILKTPYHSIDQLKIERQKKEDLNQLDWENATGVGMVLSNSGSEIENYVAIDLDGCQDENLLDEILQILGLRLDYEWVIRSGSQNGFHIVMGIDSFEDEDDYDYDYEALKIESLELLKKTLGSYHIKNKFKNKLEKMEILSDCNLVLPPSLHISTFQYKFLNCDFPKYSPQGINPNQIHKLIEIFADKLVLEKDQSTGEILRQEVRKSTIDFEEVSIRRHEKFSLRHSDYKPTYTLIFDCETTGLPVDNKLSYKAVNNWPKLIQISWVVLFWNDSVLKKKTEVVSDDTFNQIPFLNIDISSVKRVGKPIREVLESFSKDLIEVDKVVAHNIDFDMKVVQAELFRNGMEDIFQNKNLCCTMNNSFHLYKKHLALKDLHKLLLGETFRDSHNAIGDVLATTRCYTKLHEKKIKPFYEPLEYNDSEFYEPPSEYESF